MITRKKLTKAPKRPKTELERLQSKAKRERNESKFLMAWKCYNMVQRIKLVREHKFHQSRKWRFDFAHIPTRTAIEIEGGIWNGGRHTRGSGYSKDCEKYNEAAKLGWCVLRYTADKINSRCVFEVLDAITQRERLFR
jgi:hypothetical protein